jgi:2-polyprenyl-6-methoxyphenol hydroxylase-like FAD-dependent oxidoreductase
MTIIVAGAGIGGLTLALSLHQVGIPAAVFETVAEIKPLGVGINLLPHAVRELSELGLEDQLAAIAIPTQALAYYSRHGREIWREPRGRDAGYRWPQFSVHRGALQMLLLETVQARLGMDAVRFGHHFVDFQEFDGGVVAQFRGHDPVVGSVLIGADGIHSGLRARFVPDEGPPIWNGAILWRGVTEGVPFMGGRTMIMAGHEFQKFVAYPISRTAYEQGKSVINWIAELKFAPDHGWRREDWNRPGQLADFLPQFADWRFDWLDVPAVIQAANTIYEFPMVDRDPLPRWTRGRATLLGDAAHPMYPIGSNGASQAILDARALARELRAKGANLAALLTYEAERRPATSSIVLANRGNGPEQVMQMVQERAPDGFASITTVLSAAELEDVATGYKRVAGFDKDALNTRPSLIDAPA